MIPVEEIRIKTTLGEIAGKWWRSKATQPIIAVHGWQDNAGVFDTLIPLLPPDFSYLAIDWPGHGLSTHMPKGCQYSTNEMVTMLEEIRQQFCWEKISLIGHSMGAIICFKYVAVFGENVNLVCALDTLKPQVYDPKLTAKLFSYRMQKAFQIGQRPDDSTPPEYTNDELVERVYEGSLRSVNRDKAKYLLDRGCRPSPRNPNKFIISRDIRVKYMQPMYMDQPTCLEIIKRIKTPYLYIRGSDRDFREPHARIQEAVDAFRRSNPHFEMFKVEGTHHLHLNQPELIADKIGAFLKKYHKMDVNEVGPSALKCKL